MSFLLQTDRFKAEARLIQLRDREAGVLYESVTWEGVVHKVTTTATKVEYEVYVFGTDDTVHLRTVMVYCERVPFDGRSRQLLDKHRRVARFQRDVAEVYSTYLAARDPLTLEMKRP